MRNLLWCGVLVAGCAGSTFSPDKTHDAGVLDSGVLDSGVLDSGVLDSGVLDSGVLDSGVADSGVADSGVADAGAPDGGACDGLGTYGCPGDRGHYCRLTAIVTQYAGPCSADTDCLLGDVIATPPNCQGWGVCDGDRPAILATHVTAWRTAVEAEMHSYCDNLGCMGGPQCIAMDAGAACVQGVCKNVAH